MHLGLWYPKGSGIKTIVYADSDHARDYVDQKSTSGICTFIGCYLTYWFLKKQTALAISTTEAEYVSVGKACQQELWMKQALVDYGIRLDDILIMCDNKWAIDLSKNPVQHSRTKHIKIRHYSLRDNVQKGDISIEEVSSEDNIADILTKPLKRITAVPISRWNSLSTIRMQMLNTIIEDLLARCLKVKEIIDASIARIDSIRNDKAEEETSAKEAKESSYEGAGNIIGKENGSKNEKNKQPKVGPTRVEPKPRRHNRMVKAAEFWKKFVVSTSRTRKGVTSNTDAAQLAETFVEAKCAQSSFKANVGFDTICKVNVCTYALSVEKYYYFIRLMGRKASHVAAECTLQSHPNMVQGELKGKRKRCLQLEKKSDKDEKCSMLEVRV
uniref:Copia protein n=1 Tax=Tanacetum cinerariifolium TaxID=118510 RepID=A0A6L2NWN3_TANCI|nr:copia protein [Tanacetum cinerariifolium]